MSHVCHAQTPLDSRTITLHLCPDVLKSDAVANAATDTGAKVCCSSGCSVHSCDALWVGARHLSLLCCPAGPVQALQQMPCHACAPPVRGARTLRDCPEVSQMVSPTS